jgi:hypothetical protein
MANFHDVKHENGCVAATALIANSLDLKQACVSVSALARAVGQTWNCHRAINGNIIKRYKYMLKRARSFVRRLHYFREKMHLSALILNYEPRPYNGKLSILLTEREYEAGWADAWEQVAINGLESHRIPGDHGSYLRESVGIVSKIVREIAAFNEASPHAQTP